MNMVILTQKEKEIRKLKGKALRMRMMEISLTDSDIMGRCHLPSKEALSKWKYGTSWPKPAGEAILEDALEVPRGFFERAGNGATYKDAYEGPNERVLEQNNLQTMMELLVRFFGLRRELKTEWEHLRRQLMMIHDHLKEKYPRLDLSQPLPIELIQDIRRIFKIFEEEIRTGEYPDEPTLKERVKKK